MANSYVYKCASCKGRMVKFGSTRKGSPRFRCVVCKKTKAYDISGPQTIFFNMHHVEKLRPALKMLLAGFGLREIGRACGINKRTAGELRRRLEVLPSCVCGQMIGHRGWCSWRYKRSPVRQNFMKSWNRIPSL